MLEPAVAVIIPAFRAARTLDATLDSLASQTLEDFEAVVVDDGSDDATFDVASAHAGRDPRIRVVRQRNAGVAAARNAAIAATSAPLIAALDADDLWHPTFLEKLRDALERVGPRATFSYAASRVVDLQGRVLSDARCHERSGWVFHQLLLQNLIGNGSAMMFRRHVAAQAGNYDGRLQHERGHQGCEDWLLALRLAALGPVAVVPEFLVGYRSVPGAMSADALRLRQSRVHALDLLQQAVPCGSNPALRWALGSAYAKCFLHQLERGQLGAAFGNLGRALEYDWRTTLELVAGPSRWRWLWDNYAALPEEPGESFFEMDTRARFRPRPFPRDALARRWDAAMPQVLAGAPPGAQQSLLHEPRSNSPL